MHCGYFCWIQTNSPEFVPVRQQDKNVLFSEFFFIFRWTRLHMHHMVFHAVDVYDSTVNAGLWNHHCSCHHCNHQINFI